MGVGHTQLGLAVLHHLARSATRHQDQQPAQQRGQGDQRPVGAGHGLHRVDAVQGQQRGAGLGQRGTHHQVGGAVDPPVVFVQRAVGPGDGGGGQIGHPQHIAQDERVGRLWRQRPHVAQHIFGPGRADHHTVVVDHQRHLAAAGQHLGHGVGIELGHHHPGRCAPVVHAGGGVKAGRAGGSAGRTEHLATALLHGAAEITVVAVRAAQLGLRRAPVAGGHGGALCVEQEDLAVVQVVTHLGEKTPQLLRCAAGAQLLAALGRRHRRGGGGSGSGRQAAHEVLHGRVVGQHVGHAAHLHKHAVDDAAGGLGVVLGRLGGRLHIAADDAAGDPDPHHHRQHQPQGGEAPGPATDMAQLPGKVRRVGTRCFHAGSWQGYRICKRV